MFFSFEHNGATISLRHATEEDFQFAFDVKCDAMRQHIEPHWGWDEAFQLAHHSKRWAERSWFVIERDTKPIGTIALTLHSTHLQLGEFYLLSANRNTGIGSCLLERVCDSADVMKTDTHLDVLKWNPALTLYLRHGFLSLGENDSHYFCVRSPCNAQTSL